jgi:hypothetical protein
VLNRDVPAVRRSRVASLRASPPRTRLCRHGGCPQLRNKRGHTVNRSESTLQVEYGDDAAARERKALHAKLMKKLGEETNKAPGQVLPPFQAPQPDAATPAPPAPYRLLHRTK